MNFPPELPRYRPVQDNIIVQQTDGRLSQYQVPDEHFTPEIWIYFDFLRPAVVASNLAQLGDGTTITLNEIEDADRLVTAQARDRVRFYYDIFDHYFRTFGITSSLAIFGDRSNIENDDRGKQDFINLVIQHFLSDVTVQRTSAGPSTFSASFSPPLMDRRRTLNGVDPAFNFDDLLFWNHFFTKATDNFTILDQLISLHTWTYIWARGRIDPNNYRPLFTGFTTRVGEIEGGGYQGLEVGGTDMVKLLQKGAIRTNPSLGDPAAITSITGENFSIYAQPMAGASIEKIYRTLILGEEFTGVSGPTVSAGLGVLNYRELGSTAPGTPPSPEQTAAGLEEVLKAKSIPVPVLSKETYTSIPSLIRQRHNSAPLFPPKLVVWGNEIDAYRQRVGMTETRFGRAALNDGHFLRRLREGGNITLRTVERVRAFMDAGSQPQREAA